MPSDDLHRVIGTLTKISADVLTVELHKKLDNFTVVGFEDMQQVARLNSYVIIPLMDEYIVAEVINIRSKETNQSASDDSDGTLQRAIAPKYIDVAPMGVLSGKQFTFGVSTFPPLYSSVLYALEDDLNSIFGVGDSKEEKPQSVSIGSSVIFGNYETRVKINAFFGSHVAVLGNTGSGKSCTVASVLQSVFSQRGKYHATGATFLIFDVNGEYKKAFEKKKTSFPESIEVKTLELDGTNNADKFTLPHWFLNLEEWELLLQASEKTQRPVLRTALALSSLVAQENKDDKIRVIKEHFVASCIGSIFQGKDGAVGQMRQVTQLFREFGTENLDYSLLEKYDYDSKFGNFPSGNEVKLLEEISQFINPDIQLGHYKNSQFEFNVLSEYIKLAILYEEAHGNKQIRDYCSPLMTRMKNLSSDEDFKFLNAKNPTSNDEKLEEILGKSSGKKEVQIVILDMNEVGDEIVELVSAVLARMIFEYLKKKASHRGEQPVHLVLEEAHRYVAQRPSKYAIDASRVFERIAKEGRKFGMFLMVASQRPSELSKTVLSQCNNFIIHRIQNPEDLIHIKQMTPYISEPVLNRLPSLPQQHALIFGNAVNIPMTFKVRKADPTPHSDDIDIVGNWFPDV